MIYKYAVNYTLKIGRGATSEVKSTIVLRTEKQMQATCKSPRILKQDLADAVVDQCARSMPELLGKSFTVDLRDLELLGRCVELVEFRALLKTATAVYTKEFGATCPQILEDGMIPGHDAGDLFLQLAFDLDANRQKLFRFYTLRNQLVKYGNGLFQLVSEAGDLLYIKLLVPLHLPEQSDGF